jgi:predicted outer membrane protein
MRAWVGAAVALFVMMQASAVAAVCKIPEQTPPAVPNGETAGREEMVAAQAAMKVYNAAVVQYAKCVQKDGGSAIELNRIVNQLEKLAVRFNAELRKYKQKAGN